MALFVIALGGGVSAWGSEEGMTRGKVAADLGDQAAAATAFRAIVQDSKTPEDERAEALVRLGAAERAQGQAQASAATFQKALESPGRSARSTRLLALAVAGVAPAGERLSSSWSKVRLAAGSGGSRPSIRWPGDGPVGVREALPYREPVTLDLDDVPLESLLYHLLAGAPPIEPLVLPGWPASYRPPAPAIDFVIHAGVSGRVSVKAAGMPWNELFENVLASHGLGLERQGNLLVIARVSDLGAFERHRGRRYEGVHLSPWYPPVPHESDEAAEFNKEQMVRMFEATIRLHFVPDANVRVKNLARLSDYPSPEVLDLLLMADDLAATRLSATGSPLPEGTLRICRRAEAKDEVDLSQARGPETPTSRVLDPQYGLWEVPLEGNQGVPSGRPRPVALDPTIHLEPGHVHGLSSDGRYLVVAAKVGETTSVHLKDLQTGRETSVGENVVITSSLISPDGRTVVYESSKGVRSVPSAGGTPKTLPAPGILLGVSPDGRYLLTQVPIEESSVQVSEPSSSAHVDILKHAQHVLSGVRFSADGRWVAFHDGAKRLDPHGTIYVARFAGATPIPQSEWIPITGDMDTSDSPAWSPDGSLLYYYSQSDSALGIWAQRLDPVHKRPVGKPASVLHIGNRNGAVIMGVEGVPFPMGVERFGAIVFSVGTDKLVYGAGTVTLPPGARAAAARP
jgi:hypothetical protein